MREFKFRLWVSGKKEMHHSFGSIPNPSWSENERLGGYIMQYTGLEDVNENPIYEGDIVKATSASYGNIIGRVVYANGCFWILFGKEKLGRTSELLFVPLRVKIIGNVCENPELLKKKKVKNVI